MDKRQTKQRKLEVSATLNFIKVYDLIYKDKKWTFKIEIEDELSNGANVHVDIIVVDKYDGITSEKASCFYNKKILTCTKIKDSRDSTELIKLAGVKNLGTVEWENMKLKEIKIPLNTTMIFNKAYGLFFANKWNFMIDAKTIDGIPNYSKVYIDILHNSIETTATCEIMVDLSNTITNISCVSDYEIQTENDEIKINPKNKYGSLKWSKTLTKSETKISTISDYSELALDFIDAYDLLYDNSKWVFTVQGKFTQKINPGKKYLIDINYIKDKKSQDFYASCLLKEGMKSYKKIIFLCVCQYKNQGENDLIQIKYPKTETSTITWTTGISENYKITLKTSLTLVKAYNLTLSTVWSFNIDVSDGFLPKDSKVIIDLYSNLQKTSTVNCTSLSNTCIFCSTKDQTYVYLSKERSEKGSVEWKKNLQSDYRIFYSAQLCYRGAKELTFNDTDNKWYFNVNVVSSIMNAKIIIDILYGEKSSTATCISYFSPALFNCVVDEKDQSKKALIKMNKIKSEASTVIWKDLDNNDNITLVTDLTLSKTGFLKIKSKEDQIWTFDLFVEEENIPENSEIIIDVFYIFNRNIFDNYDEKEGQSTAKCIYTYKKLNCEADSTLKGHEYCINLQMEKVEGSKSSLRSWKNANDYENSRAPILLMTTLDYVYCSTIKLIENKYIFYCHFDKSSPIPKHSKVIIDILVGDKPSISYCTAEDYYNIKCEISQDDYKPNNNYISSKKTRKSTVTWNYLKTEQYLFPIELEFKQAYNAKKVYLETQYKFTLFATGDKLKDGLKFDVVIMHKMYELCVGEKYYFEEKALCEVNGGIMLCNWLSYNAKVDAECDTYYLLLRNDGDDIKWINPGNYTFIEDFWVRLEYKELISIDYNSENERYEFNLKVVQNEDYSQYHIILDLYIKKQRKYAHCKIQEDDATIINCYTGKIEYKKAIVELMHETTLGNVIWKGFSGNITLYGQDVYYVLSDNIYDLKYDSSKWKFMIKPLNIMPFEGTKKLDILINNQPGLANCLIDSNNLLACEVESNDQTNTDLIKLYDNKDSESPLQIIDMRNNEIPFNINLEFIQAYDLTFDKEKENWFFKIKAKIVDDVVIPEGSTFSTGYSYENLNEGKAFCSQDGNIENNIIILICRPEYKKSETISISLTGVNNDFSSITWKNSISEDELKIINTAELNVIKVDKLKFDDLENKWIFVMYVNDLSDTYLFVNSKVKIDLIKNNEEILGTCILEEIDKFLCWPDYENQNEDDIIKISPTKKNGSVRFINKKMNLKFGVKLTYEKYYDLKYINSKWEFKIKLSEYDIEEDDEISIDLIVDDMETYADCILNSNILLCQVKKSEQNVKNRIKLINNKQNTFIEWKNLPDVVEMFMIYEINFIEAYGGFHENHWKFNINHEALNQEEQIYENYVLLDILVNNLESTALCEITASSFLKCISNHENQQKSDVIKISGDKIPKLGTVSFQENLNDEQKIINPLTLRIIFQSLESEINDNNFKIVIKGKLNEDLENEIEKDTVTEIEIISKETKSEAVCITNEIKPLIGYIVYLSCSLEIEKIPDLDDVSINIGQNGFSKYVHLNTNDNIIITKKDTETNESQKTETNESQKTESNESQKTETNESQKTESNESQKTESNESQKTESNESQKTESNESQKTETNESQKTETNERLDNDTQNTNKNISNFIFMNFGYLLLFMVLTL